MGKILDSQECDARLAELDRPAHRDMHDLPPQVARSMEVAAAAKLREQERIIRRLRAESGRPLPWMRLCWMCDEPGPCIHREPELVGVWRVCDSAVEGAKR